MTIRYDDLYLRLHAESPRLILPGDEDMAAINGFEKAGGGISFIDEMATTLAQLVARKGFTIPGIDVDFDAYGDNDKPIHRIAKIAGTRPGGKWEICYSRPSHRFGNYNILTLPNNITVPGHEINVYDDGSGSYYRYVGGDWVEDEDAFFKNSKVNSKLRGKPRTYLKYDLRGDTFVHDNDLGREYDAEDDDPTHLHMLEVLLSVDTFFEDVIDELRKLPDAPNGGYTAWIAMTKREPVPVAHDVPPLYVCERTYGEKSADGAVLPFSGKRLVALTYAYNEKFPIPAFATEGFKYGFANAPYQSESQSWGDSPYSRESTIYKVDLKYSNDVYVVDEKPYLDCWGYQGGTLDEGGRVLMNADEIAERMQVVAKTLVPLAEYKNDYAKPIYLIHRPLWADEAQDVTRDIRRALPLSDSYVPPADQEAYMLRFREALQAKAKADEEALRKTFAPHHPAPKLKSP